MSELEPLIPTSLAHGTYNGYTNHRCRCTKCRAAAAAYRREWRRARPELEARHVARQHARGRAMRRLALRYPHVLEILIAEELAASE